MSLRSAQAVREAPPSRLSGTQSGGQPSLPTAVSHALPGIGRPPRWGTVATPDRGRSVQGGRRSLRTALRPSPAPLIRALSRSSRLTVRRSTRPASAPTASMPAGRSRRRTVPSRAVHLPVVPAPTCSACCCPASGPRRRRRTRTVTPAGDSTAGTASSAASQRAGETDWVQASLYVPLSSSRPIMRARDEDADERGEQQRSPGPAYSSRSARRWLGGAEVPHGELPQPMTVCSADAAGARERVATRAHPEPGADHGGDARRAPARRRPTGRGGAGVRATRAGPRRPAAAATGAADRRSWTAVTALRPALGSSSAGASGDRRCASSSSSRDGSAISQAESSTGPSLRTSAVSCRPVVRDSTTVCGARSRTGPVSRACAARMSSVSPPRRTRPPSTSRR